jgi:hypothetical protein
MILSEFALALFGFSFETVISETVLVWDHHSF